MYSIVFMRGLRKSPLTGFTWQRLLVETMGKVYNLINSCDKRCIILLVNDWTATSSFSEKSLATFCENRSISAIFKRVRKSMPKKDIQNGRVWGPRGNRASDLWTTITKLPGGMSRGSLQNPKSRVQKTIFPYPTSKIETFRPGFGFWILDGYLVLVATLLLSLNSSVMSGSRF